MDLGVVTDDDDDEGRISLVNIIQLKPKVRKIEAAQMLYAGCKLDLKRHCPKNPYMFLDPGSHRVKVHQSATTKDIVLSVLVHLNKILIVLGVYDAFKCQRS